MKCDQDLCLNFWYDLKKLLWQDELNPRVRCAFGNVLELILWVAIATYALVVEIILTFPQLKAMSFMEGEQKDNLVPSVEVTMNMTEY